MIIYYFCSLNLKYAIRILCKSEKCDERNLFVLIVWVIFKHPPLKGSFNDVNWSWAPRFKSILFPDEIFCKLCLLINLGGVPNRMTLEKARISRTDLINFGELRIRTVKLIADMEKHKKKPQSLRGFWFSLLSRYVWKCPSETGYFETVRMIDIPKWFIDLFVWVVSCNW